jgi:adenylate kinase
MIIILGMAGAGKSTQCRKLVADGSYQWLAVGELLRHTELGDQRAEMMTGKVLNDDIVTPLVRAEMLRMTDNPEILLDGCPRTTRQALWLTTDNETPKVRSIIHMIVDDETALERLMKRGREDDTEAAMRLRFEGYHRDIEPVLEIFRNAGIEVTEVNASNSEDTVFAEIEEVLS